MCVCVSECVCVCVGICAIARGIVMSTVFPNGGFVPCFQLTLGLPQFGCIPEALMGMYISGFPSVYRVKCR